MEFYGNHFSGKCPFESFPCDISLHYPGHYLPCLSCTSSPGDNDDCYKTYGLMVDVGRNLQVSTKTWKIILGKFKSQTLLFVGDQQIFSSREMKLFLLGVNVTHWRCNLLSRKPEESEVCWVSLYLHLKCQNTNENPMHWLSCPVCPYLLVSPVWLSPTMISAALGEEANLPIN